MSPSYSCFQIAFEVLSAILYNESTLYLWVGELQASDREDHLSCCHEEILRNLPGHVDRVRLNVHHLVDMSCTLKDRQKPRCQSKGYIQTTLKYDWISLNDLHLVQKRTLAGWSRCKSCRSPVFGCTGTLVQNYPWSGTVHWEQQEQQLSELRIFSAITAGFTI